MIFVKVMKIALVSMMVATIQKGSLLVKSHLPRGGQRWHAEGDGRGGDEGDVEDGEHCQQLAESHLRGILVVVDSKEYVKEFFKSKTPCTIGRLKKN